MKVCWTALRTQPTPSCASTRKNQPEANMCTWERSGRHMASDPGFAGDPTSISGIPACLSVLFKAGISLF